MISSEIRTELKSDVIVNFKLTKKNLPIDISIQYLLDKKIRNYIFDKNYNSIAVKFIENYNDDFHLVIFVAFEGGEGGVPYMSNYLTCGVRLSLNIYIC
jgi:capsule polysaccharide export protein KpsC/LpsZ